MMLYRMTPSGISIHAPRGGSDNNAITQGILQGISIHAPRGGSDRSGGKSHPPNFYFNPRSPWGERPSCTGSEVGRRAFQSTLPVGGATCPRYLRGGRFVFQSTLPVGGATSPGCR